MGLQYTEATLKKKTVSELKELAEDLFDEDALDEITTKQPLIDALLESAPADDDDDELEDDEVDDEAEDEADEVDDELDDEEDDDELPEVDEVDDVEEKPAKKTAAKKTKYTEGGKDGEGNKLLGAKEVATHIETDAKTLRQFFRSGKSTFNAVGAGGRYEFSEADLPKIKAEFHAWKSNKPGRGRAAGATEGTAKKRRGKAAPAIEDTIDEVEEVEDLDDLDDIELD